VVVLLSPSITMVKVGINGFGRMGRLSARLILRNILSASGGDASLELVAVNEKTGGADMAAYLLEFDSTHGKLGYGCHPLTEHGRDYILVRDDLHQT
jgi:glyceraldehyde-3-phosphate dehydrogenase/erythrose-4-phosphate dehydrogenase